MIDIIRLYAGYYKDCDLERLVRLEQLLEIEDADDHHFQIRELSHLSGALSDEDIAARIKDIYIDLCEQIILEQGVEYQPFDGDILGTLHEMVVGLVSIKSEENLDIIHIVQEIDDPIEIISYLIGEINDTSMMKYYEIITQVNPTLIENIKKLIEEDFDDDTLMRVRALRDEFLRYIGEETDLGIYKLVSASRELPINLNGALDLLTQTLNEYFSAESICRELYGIAIACEVPLVNRAVLVDKLFNGDFNLKPSELLIRTKWADLLKVMDIAATHQNEGDVPKTQEVAEYED